MAELTYVQRRARLLGPRGLHKIVAELIRAIDRLEADSRMKRPMMQSYKAVLRARDAYIAMVLEDEPEPEPEPPADPGPHPDGRPYPVPEPEPEPKEKR